MHLLTQNCSHLCMIDLVWTKEEGLVLPLNILVVDILC